MRMNEIADYVWSGSQEIEFGETFVWNQDLFMAKWAKDQPYENAWPVSGPGWYWILVNMDLDELHAIEKPSSLPAKGCNMGQLSQANNKIFGASLLCANYSGMRVIYNGHGAKLISRIRAHFALNHKKTGALGIKHYPLSSKKWSVRYFSEACITDLLPEEYKSRIKLLINSNSGRRAVESAWRIRNGWPALCKE